VTLDDGQDFFWEVFAGLAKGLDRKVAREGKKRFFGLVVHFLTHVCRGWMVLKYS
jgi:hypothetical protein